MARDGADASLAGRALGRYGGFLIAGVGFVMTRFVVAEAVMLSGAPLAVVATSGSLVVGLTLTVAGVALAVGAFRPAYVADLSRGCLLGVGAVASAFAVTVAVRSGTGFTSGDGSQLLVANVLLAGAVGGIVNGHRKASLRRRREALARGADRARFINRLLRHEVLNAATIVDGHAGLLRDADADRDGSVDAIRQSAARIESTVNGVSAVADRRDREAVPIGETLRTAVSRASDTEADAEVTVDGVGATAAGTGAAADGGDDREGTGEYGSVAVVADDRLSLVVQRLIEHAIDARRAGRVRVETDVDRRSVMVSVVDDGAPLSDQQRGVLERGAFPEYDDPTIGFELQPVSLLVSEYDGAVTAADGHGDNVGTRVAIELSRAGVDAAAATVGVPSTDLRRAVASGLVAGVLMGGVFWATSDMLPVIGALYGARSAVLGWVTHLFHSVVFALLFVAAVSTSPLRRRVRRPLSTAAAGAVSGVALWLVAAGVVMPLWLRVVGEAAPLPNLPVLGLLAHVVWGVTLGAGYALLGGRFD